MSLKERLEQLEVRPLKRETFREVPELSGSIKDKIQTRLLQMADQNKLDRDRIDEIIAAVAEEIIREDRMAFSVKEKQRLINETLDEVTGFGPITQLINDPEVTEIMVNGSERVYKEVNGRLYKTDIRFKDDNHVMHVIERIVSPLGRRIDESSPMVDARLPNGSRVNAIIPPLAIDGPTLTIRKFSDKPYTAEDLVRLGTLSSDMKSFLEMCVKLRLNIIVSGGTGSGKTTTLNVLSSFIPKDERIITIEDAAEIKLNQEHVVRLETRNANIEGRGAVTIRELVRNALRMRPDRIIVGEVRAGEALDMLQAMNTGHDGSMTTGHANSPRDVLSRIETMTMMAGIELPVKAVREQIASAIDLIVHQVRLKDGSRRITNITEVQGMEGDVITLQDIYVFKPTGRDEKGMMRGEFLYTGIKPKFMDKLIEGATRTFI